MAEEKASSRVSAATTAASRKEASEEAFLKNMMTFFKDEDGKSIARRNLEKMAKVKEMSKRCQRVL